MYCFLRARKDGRKHESSEDRQATSFMGARLAWSSVKLHMDVRVDDRQAYDATGEDLSDEERQTRIPRVARHKPLLTERHCQTVETRATGKTQSKNALHTAVPTRRPLHANSATQRSPGPRGCSQDAY